MKPRGGTRVPDTRIVIRREFDAMELRELARRETEDIRRIQAAYAATRRAGLSVRVEGGAR